MQGQIDLNPDSGREPTEVAQMMNQIQRAFRSEQRAAPSSSKAIVVQKCDTKVLGHDGH
jgi:hypothetical protein